MLKQHEQREIDPFKGYLVNDADHRAVQIYHYLNEQRLLMDNTSQHQWASSNKRIRDEIRHHLLIYLLTINAVARQADPLLCESIVQRMPSQFFSHREIESSLIDMWVRRA